MTLIEFLKSTERNAWVEHPDFKNLYVRQGPMYLEEERHDTIVLANMTVNDPGHGTFSSLIYFLRAVYPYKWIYVESVQEERFADYLLRLGFVEQPNVHRCYYLKGL